MSIKNYQGVLLGLTLVATALWIAFLETDLSFVGWALDLLALAILLFGCSFYLMDKLNVGGHPLIDYLLGRKNDTETSEFDSASDAQEDFTPNKEADWYQWRDAYYMIILPFLQANKSKNEIIAEMRLKGFPASKYLDIRRAGEMGLLTEFRKRNPTNR